MKGRIKFMVLTIISLTLLVLPGPQPSFGIGINFDTLSDFESITNQYSAQGVVFENAIALVSGFEGGSLNESDFPPFSEPTVASPYDSDLHMTLTFSTPFLSVGGYFTYTTSLALQAFDFSGNPLVTLLSLFNNNTGTGGDPGSSPNEFLEISEVGPIKSLEIYSPDGQWTLDDFTATGATSIPEPATIILVASGLAGAFGYQKRRLHKTRTNS